MYSARDVMTTDVIRCPQGATVEQAIRLLLENKVSGAPVVDARDSVVGIVSEYQLLDVVYNPELRKTPVAQLMTREVLTVTEQTLLSDVAGLFLEHRIRRLPVLRNGRLVGLISRPDLLRYALDAGEEMTEYLGALHTFAG